MQHNQHSANQAPYSISVSGDGLGFSAAHFATFGQQAEALHGHNYAVRVDVHGQLTPDAWVLDFGELREMAAALCRRLDHRFLLPATNAHLEVEDDGDGYRLNLGGRRYRFPKEDVVVLPIENSTAECLARYLAHELLRELAARGHKHLAFLRVVVEEAPGQSASYAVRLCRGSYVD